MSKNDVDLHMHSTASDGTDPPEALASIAKDAGLFAIALTDHDTTDGNEACGAACAAAGVTFVPGIELSAERGQERGTMHILGYFVGEGESLREVIAEQLESRESRNPEMIEALAKLGVDITLDEVRQQAGGTIGRPHIAAVLVHKGYAKSVQDAFTRYIGYGAPAYVRKDRLAPDRAIDAIHQAGGLAVLAHPVQLKTADLEQVVARLVGMGLDGLEIQHPDHTRTQVENYRRLARRFDLLVTGGSDYHGRRKAQVMGACTIDRDALEAMANRAARV